jgi:meiotic recombination protein SPO11
MRLRHEQSQLECPTITWLGLRTSDIASSDDVHHEQGLLKLSARDRVRAKGILAKDFCATGGVEAEWRRELQVMLTLNLKAEIQLLNARPGGLDGWLQQHGF